MAVVALSVAARFLDVPYPILLVIGGLAIGYVPGLPSVELPPELVLVLFLPPILYHAAFLSSPRDLRADMRGISFLAIGLVLTTMVVVAVTAHLLIDGLPWAAAFVLGAIVAPTDPLAATAIARRLGVPRRVVTVLEGEALVNDATALVGYRIALAAIIGSNFVAWEAALRFMVSTGGGVAIGFLAGWLVVRVERRLEDPPVEIILSLVAGYAAYLPAETLHVSGVLAAVTAGLYVGWRAPEIVSSATRLLGASFWEVFTYLLNAALFILIGLQLRAILGGVTGRSAASLLALALAISASVIGTRIAWVFTVPYLVRFLDRRDGQHERRVGPRERLITGWSGMRGAVSLAAALALPLELSSGEPFPQRNLIIFLTFAVIFATLVLQGLTLPALIGRLRVERDDAHEREELRARLRATEAALARIEELAIEDWVRDDTAERLRGMYEYRHRRLSARGDVEQAERYEERSLSYQRIVREVIEAQRREIVRLRNEGVISNEVMHRIEHDLDLEDSRLEI